MVGDIISEGARRAAVGDITRVFAGASAKALDAGVDVLVANARAPFTLLDVDLGTLSRFIDRFQDTALWVDEGNCFNRAMLGAHMLDGMVGLGATPASDAFVAGIAISRHHVGPNYVGGFHAAVAVKLPYVDELMVIDPLPGSPRMQPLSSWSRDPEPLLLRPFAGTGLWDGVGYRSSWVGSGYFDGARDLLSQTWNAAEQYGVTVRPLGTMPPAHRIGN